MKPYEVHWKEGDVERRSVPLTFDEAFALWNRLVATPGCREAALVRPDTAVFRYAQLVPAPIISFNDPEP